MEREFTFTDDLSSLNYPVPCKVELNSQYSDAIIESISHCKHLKTVLLGRFIKFSNTLMNSENMVLRYIAVLNKNDNRTIFGQNLNSLAWECNHSLEALSKEVIHRNVKVSHQDPTELWRQEIINEIKFKYIFKLF